MSPSAPAPGAPAKRPGLLARLGQAILITAISIVVPLLLIEVGLRLFAPQDTAVNVSEWDPLYGWRNRPGARGFFRTREFRMEVRIDSLGLRDDETTWAKPAGTWRILGLGDSFAFGHGVAVDSCFLAVAERALDQRSRARGGPRVEVLNSGVGKWGTAAEFLYLRHEGLRFSPDAVVLAFCVDNDFDNNADESLLRLEGGHLVKVATPEPSVRKVQRLTRMIPGYAFLAEHSHLVNFLRVRASALDTRATTRAAQQRAGAADSAAADRAAWDARKLPITRMLMDSLAAECRAENTRFVVLMIPGHYQTLPESRWQGPMFQDPRPAAALAAQVVAHLDSIGVPVVYPLDALTSAERTRELYFLEGHLNEAGSRIVGEALADALEKVGAAPGGEVAANSARR